MELRALIEAARGVAGLAEDEGDPELTYKRAVSLMTKAQKRGDDKAASYWKQVAQHAKAQVGGGGAAPIAPKPIAPKKSLGQMFRDGLKAAKDAMHKALGTVKDVGAKTATALRNLPKHAQRMVQDKSYRAEVGKQTAEALRRKGKAAIGQLKKEGAIFKNAGKSLVKVARGKPLTRAEKGNLKHVAKVVAVTAVGGALTGGGAGLVTGGLAKAGGAAAQALTMKAIAGDLAKDALKRVGTAALTASVYTEDAEAETLDHWIDSVLDTVIQGFDRLGDMDQDKLAKLLIKAHGADAPRPEAPVTAAP